MNNSLQTITDQILVFTMDELAYALPLASVVKVIHSVEIRPLPEAPEIISGIINIKGQIIPVADIRRRFGLTKHETGLNDHLIIADTGKREIAVLVDNVSGIRDLDKTQFDLAKKSVQFAKYISGVAKIDDSLALIYDLELFMSLDEEKELEHALNLKTDES